MPSECKNTRGKVGKGWKGGIIAIDVHYYYYVLFIKITLPRDIGQIVSIIYEILRGYSCYFPEYGRTKIKNAFQLSTTRQKPVTCGI